VKDEMGSLRNIYSALEPGGRAIILVPQGQGVYGTLDMALGHFRRYSRSELKQRMEQVGFRVERVLNFNRISLPGWYINGRWFKRTTIGRIQLRIFDRLVWLWRAIDPMLPWQPTSIIAIAVRDR
jgi:hypothetical protein